MFKGNRKLLEDVLEGLFHIAWADNRLDPREEQFLAQVAKRFGFTDTEFRLHQRAPRRCRGAQSLSCARSHAEHQQ